MEDVFIPIFLFASIVGVIWLFSHYNYKKRLTAHETLRLAVEKGQEVSPELVERMSYLNDPAKSDLRRGILLIAFGLAFISLGMLIPHDEPDAFRGMLGVSSFPIILGAAYLGLWRFSHD
ncbi:MAG: phage shock protein B [Hyphomonadaceae bacterium]|nr:phage shock protein B [Hyphomonadaceae bacterium]